MTSYEELHQKMTKYEKLSRIVYNITASLGIVAGCAGALNAFIEVNTGKKTPSSEYGYLATSIALIANSASMLGKKKKSKLEEKLEG